VRNSRALASKHKERGFLFAQLESNFFCCVDIVVYFIYNLYCMLIITKESVWGDLGLLFLLFETKKKNRRESLFKVYSFHLEILLYMRKACVIQKKGELHHV